MQIQVGHFDTCGNPCLKIHLCGISHAEPGPEFAGIVDTGFTGFIQLPIQHAFSLKLPLDGTVTTTLADGSSVVCLTALAKTTFAGKMVLGVVILEKNSQDILIGMDFLRQFQASLIVAKGAVVVLDEDWLEKAVTQQNPAPSGQETPTGSATPSETTNVPESLT